MSLRMFFVLLKFLFASIFSKIQLNSFNLEVFLMKSGSSSVLSDSICIYVFNPSIFLSTSLVVGG